MRIRYRRQSVFAQMNLLDSHDVSRFLSLCGKGRGAYELAVLFLMTFPGMPSIFYGDELGVEGVLEDEYRQAMPWGREDTLLSFYREAIRLRNGEKALRQGSFRTVSAEKGSRLYVYERRLPEESVLVAMNMEENDAALMPEWLEGRILWQRGLRSERLGSRGFAVIKKEW